MYDAGMTTSEGGPRLYTILQAAERLGISRARVYQLLDEGKLRSVKIGSRRLVRESALAEFIDSLEEG